jgi:outer membrane protein OmpA-like peptidoglycan-associated protein
MVDRFSGSNRGGNVMTRRVASAVAVSLLVALPALAQESAANPTLPLDRFRTPIDTNGFAVTEGGDIPAHLEYQVGAILDYSLNPLVIRDVSDPDNKRVVAALVSNRIATNVLFELGLFEYVGLGVNLPVLLFQNNASLQDFTGAPGIDSGLAALGIGDLKLAPKIRVLRQDQHFVSLSLLTAVTLPTASGLNFSDGFSFDYGTSYLGEGPAAFSIIPELALSADYFGARGAVNLGYRLRPPVYYSTPRGTVQINPEIEYRFGVGYNIGQLPALTEKLGVGGDLAGLPLPSVLVFFEMFGATSDRNPFGLFPDASRDADEVEQEAQLSNALEWDVGVRWALPWYDLHVEGGLGSGLVSGFGTPDFRLFAGVRWAPVEKDRDDDGVLDADDACPSDPEDADGYQDSDGCPDADNDSDGLPDADDQCPDEAEDVDGFADNDGCPDGDNDEDGVADADDKCPDEAGSPDQQGCPVRDRDGDGVPDEADECPDEQGPGDRKGCPIRDTDADGVNDDVDECPEEAGPPDRNGCPLKDRDADGIEDKDDECPDNAGPVERKGCPIGDKDLDGVLDEDDKCPEEKGVADRQGCPIPDKDGDGIEDKIDVCPEAAGPPVLKGCPDGDGDGVADKDDKCPEAPGVAMFDGCADTDSDGVPDNLDKCVNEPEVINGVDDDDGCPDEGKQIVVVTKEKIEIRETVLFRTSSTRIDKKSYPLLDQVAQVLKANPQIQKIRVEGHTDSVGSDKTNKRLSQGRAESVVKYLVGKGVDASRLFGEGFGEEQPIGPNDTEEGRAANRRVEFVIVEQ